MSFWKKITIGVLAWLASGLVVYLLPEEALPAGWHRELLGLLALPVILLGWLVISGIVELGFLGLTHAVVRLASFGTARVEGPNEFVRTNWGVGRDSEGKLVLDEDLAGVGTLMVICGAIALGVYFL